MKRIHQKLGYFFLPMAWALSMGCATQKVNLALPNSIIQAFTDSLGGGHGGVLVQDLETGSTKLEYQSHLLFTPASNTKLLTTWASLSHLGDSLVACRYAYRADTLFIEPGADPTLLHPVYAYQPLKELIENHLGPVVLITGGWQTDGWGKGWSWNDYMYYYMAERSPMPVFENQLRVRYFTPQNGTKQQLSMEPSIEVPVSIETNAAMQNGYVFRQPESNNISIVTNGNGDINQLMTVSTRDYEYVKKAFPQKTLLPVEKIPPGLSFKIMHSQPLLPVLEKMMHESDNFLAEQLLLMVSKKMLGYFNEDAVIDTLRKNGLAGLPDKFAWVDGSGLSRYNLQSPANYVALLKIMHSNFGMQNLKQILPTAGEGTMEGRFKNMEGMLYAKTGTLSGQVALSGYLQAKSGKWLVFSVLISNHATTAGKVRAATERLLRQVREEN